MRAAVSRHAAFDTDENRIGRAGPEARPSIAAMALACNRPACASATLAGEGKPSWRGSMAGTVARRIIHPSRASCGARVECPAPDGSHPMAKKQIIISVFEQDGYYFLHHASKSQCRHDPSGPVSRSLVQLGLNLQVAGKRRKETMAAFAERMQVSVPTLRKMEQGDPSVSVAVYAMALWLVGRLKWLPEIANPAADDVALDTELSRLQRPAVKSQAKWTKP